MPQILVFFRDQPIKNRTNTRFLDDILRNSVVISSKMLEHDQYPKTRLSALFNSPMT